MPISITVSNDNAVLVLEDIKQLFPQLANAQEPPRDPAPAANDDKPKERKPRAKRNESEAGELGPANAEASSASKDNGSDVKTAEPSSAEIPDIEAVRHALKSLGAADGFGHDKVFEVLGRYKATNASTVPEDRRADLIAEIEALLKGGK